MSRADEIQRERAEEVAPPGTTMVPIGGLLKWLWHLIIGKKNVDGGS